MHDSSVILCEPFLHFLLPSGMMDKTDGRDRRMAQYYMLYKPRGLLTAKRDARRETVMSCFPEALRETVRLRLAYPTDSLAELAQRFDPPISKPGLSHRLKKITEFASKED